LQVPKIRIESGFYRASQRRGQIVDLHEVSLPEQQSSRPMRVRLTG
jgi:hypothetical protein